MNKMKYEMLVELNSRMEAELLKSHLEAEEIPVELFQESIGKNIYPVTISGMGTVQIFVPKENIKEAREVLKIFLNKE
jgi:hypothetical protein